MSPPNDDTDTHTSDTTAAVAAASPTATTTTTCCALPPPLTAMTTSTEDTATTTTLPKMPSYGERLVIPEWDHHHHHHHCDSHSNNNSSSSSSSSSSSYRIQHGWAGQDLIHSPHTSNVYLVDSYYVQQRQQQQLLHTNTTTNDEHDNSNSHNNKNSNAVENRIGTTVTGYVHFTPQAESHRGFCHGGAACSIMDDVIGWTAFCAPLSNTTNNNDTTNTNDGAACTPWSGYTVQINTTLRRPIPIDSYLYVQGVVTNIVRRKVYVTATLYRPTGHDEDAAAAPDQRIVYATAEGIVVMNPNVILQRPRHDNNNHHHEMATRTNKMNMGDDNERS